MPPPPCCAWSPAISTACASAFRPTRSRSRIMAVHLRHAPDDLAESHEINVTPFIDVVLVLLIIFMVAAPLATVDVPVDLPSASAEPPARPDKPIFVTFKADHSLAVGDAAVERAGLAQALDVATA